MTKEEEQEYNRIIKKLREEYLAKRKNLYEQAKRNRKLKKGKSSGTD